MPTQGVSCGGHQRMQRWRKPWLTAKLHGHNICRRDMGLDCERYGVDKFAGRRPPEHLPPQNLKRIRGEYNAAK